MLHLCHVSKSFRSADGTAIDVLRDVSLTVDRGQVMALVGPNGSGKTTLLNIIAGEVAEDSGEITLGGQTLTRGRPFARSQCVGHVHQESHRYFAVRLTVGEILALASRRGLPLRLAAPRSRAALIYLEELSSDLAATLAQMETMRASQLSGGQRQLLALAAAALGAPPLLLLDEHLASLDQRYKQVADALVGGLAASLKCAVIVATHDPKWVARWAHSVGSFSGLQCPYQFDVESLRPLEAAP